MYLNSYIVLLGEITSLILPDTYNSYNSFST